MNVLYVISQHNQINILVDLSVLVHVGMVSLVRKGNSMPSKKCPLRNDWKKWDKDKQSDRLFMICPACGKNGSHVNER